MLRRIVHLLGWRIVSSFAWFCILWIVFGSRIGINFGVIEGLNFLLECIPFFLQSDLIGNGSKGIIPCTILLL